MNFGPWVGELGWEICWAIPMLRHLKAMHRTWLRVAAPAGHEYLWRGIADRYVPVETNGGTSFVDGELLAWRKRHPGRWRSPKHFWERYGKAERRYLFSAGCEGKSTPRCWVPYIEPAIHRAEVLLAIRPPKNGDASKSWPAEYGFRLAALLLCRGISVATIGGTDNQHIDGVLDLRGIPWPELVSAIRGARCVVGPSSGPLVFALLCQARKVVSWYARTEPPNVEFRYRTAWNPFNAPVEWIDGIEYPTPERVIEVFA